MSAANPSIAIGTRKYEPVDVRIQPANVGPTVDDTMIPHVAMLKLRARFFEPNRVRT